MLKKNYLLIFIIIFSMIISFSQTGWFQLQPGVTSDFYSLYFTSASAGYVVGNEYILKTTNAGLTWFIQVDNLMYRFRSIVFINPNTGIVVGRDGYILKTTNAGANWVPKNCNNINDLLELFMYDNNNGFIAGGFETFLRTTDCGETWSGYTLGENYHMYSVNFPSTNEGWIVGGGGRIFKSTDFGISWTLQQNSPTTIELYEVLFLNQLTGWIVGEYGVCLKTYDGGNNWSTQDLGSSRTHHHIIFFNSQKGWIVGDTDILCTINGGNTWNLQQSNHPNTFVQSFFTSDSVGYIAGWGSTILKTTTGGNPIGIKSISQQVPKAFALYQNYPNPFNPSTKIKFEIAGTPLSPLYEKGGSPLLEDGGLVTLKIYDILGREIATLVNEKLQQGTYEVEWDASNYPSGIYFYKLTVSNPDSPVAQGSGFLFSQTIRMVLLK